MSSGDSLQYRSPISKLLSFFHRSRDKWKAKCKAAKRENRSLKYCLAKMTENRDRWKSLAREARRNAVVAEETTKSHTAGYARGRRDAARRRPARCGIVAAK